MSNTIIYKKWCEYQRSKNLPIPEYSIEAYSQNIIDLWKSILYKVNSEH